MGLVAHYRLALFPFDYLVVFDDTTCFPFSPQYVVFAAFTDWFLGVFP